MHQSFSDIAQAKGIGVVTSTVIGLLRDEIGQRFAARYISRFGKGSTPHIGCQSYSALHHFALAASLSGRRYYSLQPALIFNLDQSGNYAITSSDTLGDSESSGNRGRLAKIAFSAKF